MKEYYIDMPKGHFHTLVRQIRDAVRAKALEIPEFKESGNGAIRICAYPYCKEADEWLGGYYDTEKNKWCGGLSSFDGDSNDIVDYEFTFAISPGGSRVIERDWGEGKVTIDCYAFSALKIAHCSRAQDEDAGLISGLDLNNPHLTEENGYGPYKGAICVEVKKKLPDFLPMGDVGLVPTLVWEMSDFYGIYVCVSGADSEDDLKCAEAAIEVIKKFHDDEAFTKIVTPKLPKSE